MRLCVKTFWMFRYLYILFKITTEWNLLVSNNYWFQIEIFWNTYRTVEAQVEKHHEEYQRPKHRARHSCYGRRINDEHQTRPFGGHVLNLSTRHVGHITENSENNETGQKTRDRITHDRQICISKQRTIWLCIFTGYYYI